MAIRSNAIRIFGNAKRMYEESGEYPSEILESDLTLPMYVANAYIEIITKALPESFCRNGFWASRLGDVLKGNVSVYFAPPDDPSIKLPTEEAFIIAVNNLDINTLSNPCMDFARRRCLSTPSIDYKSRLLNPFGDKNWVSSVVTSANHTAPMVNSGVTH